VGTTSKPGVRAVSNFTFIFVGIGVRESGRLSSLPAKEPVQAGASLVLASFLYGMALSTTSISRGFRDCACHALLPLT